MNLVCPSCDAVGRTLAQHVDLGVRCDKCGAEMFAGHSIALDDAIRLQKHIVSNDIPVLVNFWAPWCGPCRVMASEFEEAALRLEPHLRLVKVNTDEAQEIGTRYGVEALPTMILFFDGRELARYRGSIKAADIVNFAADQLETEAAGA